MEDHVPALEGRLIRLRAHEPADVDALNDLINDPKVGEGLGMNMPQPIEGFQAFVDAATKNPDQAPFVIERLSDRKPVGGCSLFQINGGARTAVLGIWLGKPFWDEGLGTDAVRTLCRFGFRHMNLQRIELDVFETNARALRAYEKVGFTLEGTRRRSEFVQGRHVGSHIMGLLVEDLIDD